MALAVRARPGRDRERAVGVGLRGAPLAVQPEGSGHLDVAADADAQHAALSLLPARALLLEQVLVAGRVITASRVFSYSPLS